ncbi:MAG: acetylornithine deacetylase [Burkholderiaceae bacterium]|jgi:acetylornithine deacetylase|nr:acetylornithine deacetylase [Pseudomonadota bacterium]MBS0596352.1 acetylornithine deacetylase [Pseudomonadota bacterium]MCO5117536.1 acetylornithine deacetylase [Burkholderiaceae bacterium]MCP5217771.1 acetylornithine deacetylase [Burkholderiaceae bacterium]
MTTPAWLERLVAIDTTSRNSNLGLIETVRDALAGHGLAPWLAANAEGSKANLFCTLPAQDGQTQGGIVLSGHTDVVPVDGQDWTSDPFRLTDKGDGRLYGRGSCDMKGFIASSLALVPQALAMPRKKPLHLAFSYDEELGCLGAPVMLRELQARGIRADGCVVGEPTSMKPVVAHKGGYFFHCRVHGRAAHSSLTPQGCNAIEYAARLICHIRDLADAWRTQGPYDEAFDVPYSTITTNLIAGGIAANTVPESCTFSFDFRHLPGHGAEDIQADVRRYVDQQLLPRMRREYAGARIDIECGASVAALDASEQAAITTLVRALTDDRGVRKVAYGTEAGQFTQAGIPAVLCGPGSIEQAHKADEWVELEQLAQCDRFLRRIAESLC